MGIHSNAQDILALSTTEDILGKSYLLSPWTMTYSPKTIQCKATTNLVLGKIKNTPYMDECSIPQNILLLSTTEDILGKP